MCRRVARREARLVRGGWQCGRDVGRPLCRRCCWRVSLDDTHRQHVRAAAATAIPLVRDTSVDEGTCSVAAGVEIYVAEFSLRNAEAAIMARM